MLNLGGLFFTLDADTRGLQNAQRRIEKFADDVRAAFRGVGKGTVDPGFANSLGRQEKAMVSFVQKINQLQQRIATIKFTPQGAREAQVTMERLGMAFDNFTRKLTSGPLDSNIFQRRMSQMTQAMSQAQRNISMLANTAGKGVDATPWAHLSNVLQGLGSASLVVQGHLGGMSTRFFGLTTLVREFGVVAAVTAASIAGLSTGMITLLGHSVRVGMQMQTIHQQFMAISGSAAIAEHDIRFVQQTADKAGLSFQDLATSYAKFNAAAINSGLTLTQTEKVFAQVSQTAGTLHLSNEQVGLSFLALEQMLSKGTVYTEELRRQLGDQIPAAMKIAADAMGVTQVKLMQMLKDGVIPATEFVPKFADALVKAFHIDMTRPIDTFRASLNRLQNEWTYLGVNVGQSTNLLGALGNVVNRITAALRYLSNNLITVVGIIGAFTGAVVGATAAYIAFQFALAAPTLFRSIIAFVSLATEVRNLTGAMALLRAAFIGLQTTTLVGLLVTLAAAVAGAVIGFKMFSNAVSFTAEQLNTQIGSMTAYIGQSEAMGTQIRSVTQDLLNQNIALQKNASIMAASANAALNAAKSSGVSIGDVISSATTGDVFHPSTLVSPSKARENRIRDLQATADQWNRTLMAAGTAYAGLEHVSTLPEQVGTAVDRISKDKAGRGLDGIINKIKDLMQAADTAKQSLDALAEPLASGESMKQRIKDIQDFGKAFEITNNLKPKQLAAAAATLGVPNNINDINNALVGYIRTQREATDAVNEFVNIWDEVEKGRQKLEGLNRELSYIGSLGGAVADPRQMRFLENMQKADETLYKLTQDGPSGAKALEALKVQLEGMGYSTGNLTQDFALFLTQLDEAGEKVKALNDIHTKIRDLGDEVAQMQLVTSGYKGSGGLFGNLFGADMGETMQEAVNRGKAAVEQIRALQAAGVPGAQISEEIAKYIEGLRQVDAQKYILDKQAQAWGRVRDSMRSMISDGLNGIKDFLSGTKNLKDTLLDLAKSFLDTGWQNFIIAPLQDLVSGIGRKKGVNAAAGTDIGMANAAMQILGLGKASQAAGGEIKGNLLGSISGLIGKQVTEQAAAGSATSSMLQLALAARSAAASLATIGAGGASSGGGGLLGTILKIGGAVAGAFGGNIGAIGGGIASVGGTIANSGGIAAGAAAAIPHGFSGAMTAGSLYRVNEPGVMGEYFIPRVSGYMSPNAPTGGHRTFIDAHTTINAPGADAVALAQLQEFVNEKDARLRQEIPYMVDARVMDSSHRGRYSN